MLAWTMRDGTKHIADPAGVIVDNEAGGLWQIRTADGAYHVTADLRWMEPRDAVAWLTDCGRHVAGAPVDRALLEGVRSDLQALGLPEADELVFRIEQIIRSE